MTDLSFHRMLILLVTFMFSSCRLLISGYFDCVSHDVMLTLSVGCFTLFWLHNYLLQVLSDCYSQHPHWRQRWDLACCTLWFGLCDWFWSLWLARLILTAYTCTHTLGDSSMTQLHTTHPRCHTIWLALSIYLDVFCSSSFNVYSCLSLRSLQPEKKHSLMFPRFFTTHVDLMGPLQRGWSKSLVTPLAHQHNLFISENCLFAVLAFLETAGSSGRPSETSW